MMRDRERFRGSGLPLPTVLTGVPALASVEPMDYRMLGGSGCAVSSLCLGTMTFGAETDEPGAHAQLDRFLEAGGTLVDTADVYAGGSSEEIIGRWLASRPADVTDRVVLATKGRFPIARTTPNGVGLSARHLTRALDASLRRLGVETRRPLPGPRVRPAHAAGGDPAHPRRVRPGRQDPLLRPVELHRLAADQGRAPRPRAERSRAGDAAAAVQPAGPRDRVGDRARRLDAGLGLLPWSPLGGGWLSGKYRRDQRPTGATRLGEDPNRGMEAYDRRGTDAHLGRHRRRPEGRRGPRRLDGRGRPRLGDRPARASRSTILGARTTSSSTPTCARPGCTCPRTRPPRSTPPATRAPADYPYGELGVDQRARTLPNGH